MGINLRSIANNAISAINPNRPGTILISTGYSTGPDGHRTPSYAPPQAVAMQIQALTVRDLRQVDGLGVAGSTHTIYVDGKLAGLVRPDNKGGDLVLFDGRIWLVTAVLEDWDTWTKCSATLQNTPASEAALPR